MEERARAQLLARARDYAALKGDISLFTLGKLAVKDPGFFVRLERETGTFTFRLYDRANRWFDENWPEEASLEEVA